MTKFTSELEIVIDFPDWGEFVNLPNLYAKLEQINDLVIHHVNIPEPFEGRVLHYSLVLESDENVKGLNRDYRNKDKATNVLSFALLDSEDELDFLDMEEEFEGYISVGDLVFAFETVLNESKALGISFEEHFVHLIIHGLLHLLGYDHIEDSEAKVMEALEVLILSKIGIENPYEL